MKYIYLIIILLCSCFVTAYDIGTEFNITTVPMCNNYNMIKVNEVGQNTTTGLYPIGNCSQTISGIYECPCTEDNIIKINTTSIGTYDVVVTYYITDVSNMTRLEKLYNARLLSFYSIQITEPPYVSDITLLLNGLEDNPNSGSIVKWILVFVAIVTLIVGIVVYKFIIVPFRKAD